MVGGLVGAHPLQPRQNSQLGLPLHIMPEEISLLREEGEAASLLADRKVRLPPCSEGKARLPPC